MNPDCNPIDQQQRQDALEAAYIADGRDNPSHPQHCLYGGLNIKAEATVEDLLQQWWKDSFPNAPINSKTGELMVQFANYVLQERCSSAA